MAKSDYMKIEGMKFTTKSGTDVKDTQFLKGEAKNSLSGSNTTVADERSCKCSSEMTGGKPVIR